MDGQIAGRTVPDAHPHATLGRVLVAERVVRATAHLAAACAACRELGYAPMTHDLSPLTKAELAQCDAELEELWLLCSDAERALLAVGRSLGEERHFRRTQQERRARRRAGKGGL